MKTRRTFHPDASVDPIDEHCSRCIRGEEVDCSEDREDANSSWCSGQRGTSTELGRQLRLSTKQQDLLVDDERRTRERIKLSEETLNTQLERAHKELGQQLKFEHEETIHRSLTPKLEHALFALHELERSNELNLNKTDASTLRGMIMLLRELHRHR